MDVRRDPWCGTLRTMDFGHPAAASGFFGSLHHDKTGLGDRICRLEAWADHSHAPEQKASGTLPASAVTAENGWMLATRHRVNHETVCFMAGAGAHSEDTKRIQRFETGLMPHARNSPEPVQDVAAVVEANAFDGRVDVCEFDLG
jgi:hypothetical protein